MSDAVAPQAGTAAFPWWVLLLQGIAAVVIGGLLMVQTVPTTIILVLFFGWWWLISGIFEIVSIFFNREQWGWKLFTGLLSVLAGGYIIAAPLLGAAVVVGVATLLLGINGMIIGVVDIIKAFQGAGWGKGILGALSFVIGAVIAFNFTSFMVALPWVWGLFAIAFGIAAIAGSFVARKAQA
jgi:uncharacterized membrane protein HdeD (DUF308 family)